MINYNSLNKEQLTAVKHIEGPLLILAGAGTGKTKTIVYRAAYMIENKILPENILMLTFTNKAAREMKERLTLLLGENSEKSVAACTFHSFCTLMLRFYGEEIGISKNFTVISPSDDMDVISIVKTYCDKSRFAKKGFPPSGKICDFISMAVNKNIDMYDVVKETKYVDFLEEIKEIDVLSRNYRAEHNLLNYDDILVRFIDLLNLKQDIAKRIANKYKYIMVDEYQDTNPLQEDILKELFKYTKNIAVVGDDMQSLYGFRGAVVENIINFPDKFEGCEVITLVCNYRSSQEILNLSNDVMKYTTEGIPKELIGTYSSKIKPEIVKTNNQLEETEAVYNIIQKCHNDGIDYKDICVIERNSILSAGLEIKLNTNGVLYDKYGGMKFTDLDYVRDVLAYLKIMTNPYDEISWFRVLKVHKGIGVVNARHVSEECKKDGVSALLSKKYEKRVYGAELKRLHNTLCSLNGKKLKELIKEFIKFYCDTKQKNIEEMDTDEGYRTQYLNECKSQRNELQKLLEIAASYRSINSFLDDLLLDNTKINEHDGTGNLVISTIHSVKGLEFKVVVVLDCVDGVFPRTEDIGGKEDNEELRCFYVAITRAKEQLYIMCPKKACLFGTSIYCRPSRYLKDVNFEGIVLTCCSE